MCRCNNCMVHILFFGLFIFCAKEAFERSLAHIKQERPSAWKKFPVHELDKGFLFAIKEVKKQVKHAIALAKTKENCEQLGQIKKQLDTIEKKYKKNSPATFLLGPLGTTSIILKEKRLEKELLAIVNTISNILHHSVHIDPDIIKISEHIQDKKLKTIHAIESGIIQNNKLIESMC